MVFINGYRPQMWRWTLFFCFGLPSSCSYHICFWSVLPNLQASSGQISEVLRAMQRQLFWRYIESIIGTTSIPALKGKAGLFCCANRQSAAKHSANYKIFADFSYSPRFAYQRSTNRSAQHKGNMRTGEARTPVHRALPIVIEIAY